jgi:hypothetical protein
MTLGFLTMNDANHWPFRTSFGRLYRVAKSKFLITTVAQMREDFGYRRARFGRRKGSSEALSDGQREVFGIAESGDDMLKAQLLTELLDCLLIFLNEGSRPRRTLIV